MAKGPLEVRACIPGQKNCPDAGVLTFVNNEVDSTTGTIQLKATFANQDERLWPGLFVDVILTLLKQPNAIVIPARAVQTGQEGQYVFVVRPDLTVEHRPVTVERSLDGQVVISHGLAAGEQVVTDGQLRLAQGSKIRIKTGTAPAGEAPKP
jgi:multidrug efflux system membrane fusion protein